MDLKDLKLNAFGIDKKKFGRIFCFVDYGNVNYWYDKDRRSGEGNQLNKYQRLIVDIEKLAYFVSGFAEQKRFYYGWNPRNKTNWHITIKAEKYGFVKITKPMQFIRHEVGKGIISHDGKKVLKDDAGNYYRNSKK